MNVMHFVILACGRDSNLNEIYRGAGDGHGNNDNDGFGPIGEAPR